jgi:hypothetical protein
VGNSISCPIVRDLIELKTRLFTKPFHKNESYFFYFNPFNVAGRTFLLTKGLGSIKG